MGGASSKPGSTGAPAPEGQTAASPTSTGSDGGSGSRLNLAKYKDQYVAFPIAGLENAPRRLLLILDTESLHVHDADTSTLFKVFAFHRILCWGYTGSTFQWRAYVDDSESEVVTCVVETGDGLEIEAHMMACVMALMTSMKSRGVPDGEFAELVNTLQSLAEQGHAEHCLAAVRQMALGRAFDARQALTLVSTIGTISPFDKLEAAVALYPTLLASESFLIVLQAFEDAEERSNICHRLGLKLTPEGALLQWGKRRA